MGFRAFVLNSEKGVKTPRWRILGSENAIVFGANFYIKNLLLIPVLLNGIIMIENSKL